MIFFNGLCCSTIIRHCKVYSYFKTQFLIPISKLFVWKEVFLLCYFPKVKNNENRSQIKANFLDLIRINALNAGKVVKCQTLLTGRQRITGRRCSGHEVSPSVTSVRVDSRPRRTWLRLIARFTPFLAPSCWFEALTRARDVQIFRVIKRS